MQVKVVSFKGEQKKSCVYMYAYKYARRDLTQSRKRQHEQ